MRHQGRIERQSAKTLMDWSELCEDKNGPQGVLISAIFNQGAPSIVRDGWDLINQFGSNRNVWLAASSILSRE